MYYIALCNVINVSLSSVRTEQAGTDGAEQVLYRETALSVPLSLDLCAVGALKLGLPCISLWQCMAPEVTFCEHRESKTRYMEVALIYKLVELKMMFIFYLYWTKKRLACNSNKKAKVNSAEKNLSKKDEGAPSNDRRKRWITEERSVLLSAEKWWHLLHFCEYLKFYQVKERIFFFLTCFCFTALA